jgi:hypothetical protein
MIFPNEPGGILIQPNGQMICCLMKSNVIGPSGFTADEKTLRDAKLGSTKVDAFLDSKKIGYFYSLRYSVKEGCLYAYGSLSQDIDCELTTHLAIPKFMAKSVRCGSCNSISGNTKIIGCSCISKSPCLMLTSICVNQVHFYAKWNEGSKEEGSRLEYMSNLFSETVSHIQIVDPL